MKRMLLAAAVVSLVIATSSGLAGAATARPDMLSSARIKAHGQHIVGDYVTGSATWNSIGRRLRASSEDRRLEWWRRDPRRPRARLPLPDGFAPGASFCNGSNSPGTHL